MLPACRVLVSLALLGGLLTRISLNELGEAFRSFPASGLMLGVLVLMLQLVVGAQRWRRLLLRVGSDLPLHSLLQHMLVASAYTMILPSSVGGDVVRALRCGRQAGVPHRGWSTVFFERMIGFPCLALVAMPGVLVLPGGRALFWAAIGAAVVGAGGLVLAGGPLRWAARVLMARAPQIAALSEGIAADLEGPLGTAGARAEALLWTLLYQGAGISILAAVVAPRGDPGLLGAIYAGVPLVVLGAMLPVSLGGVGLRESLFVLVLGRLGVDRATALALGLLWLGTYFALAIPGGFLVLWEVRSRAEGSPA
ncbi:MAG: lysylphosphatidylglycerol synthase transmembrane domain-containing protein [Myxococcales bacterium]|nr:flippase-like domain-containing protein [Polyangiaceae bacterium]MDW8249780.1 lysylphosphatidylglycerol synthase transmembrane domain-containing protein [Myxococcales bacterium]